MGSCHARHLSGVSRLSTIADPAPQPLSSPSHGHHDTGAGRVAIVDVDRGARGGQGEGGGGRGYAKTGVLAAGCVTSVQCPLVLEKVPSEGS